MNSEDMEGGFPFTSFHFGAEDVARLLAKLSVLNMGTVKMWSGPFRLRSLLG